MIFFKKPFMKKITLRQQLKTLGKTKQLWGRDENDALSQRAGLQAGDIRHKYIHYLIKHIL